MQQPPVNIFKAWSVRCFFLWSGNLLLGTSKPQARHTQRLLDDLKTCGVTDLISLYQELSHEIHGAPWYGNSVKVHASKLSKKEHACLIKKLVDHLGLKMESL